MKVWFHRSKPNVPLHDVRVLEYDLAVVRSWIRGMLAMPKMPLVTVDRAEEVLDAAMDVTIDGYLAAAAAASDEALALTIATGRGIEINEGNPPLQIEFKGNADEQQ